MPTNDERWRAGERVATTGEDLAADRRDLDKRRKKQGNREEPSRTTR